jgi:hypothetical protein
MRVLWRREKLWFPLSSIVWVDMGMTKEKEEEAKHEPLSFPWSQMSITL